MDAARRARLLGLWSLLVYLFLYAPLAVLAAFSFNEERLTAQWRGFTLDWYARLLENTQILTALRNSLLVAVIATAIATAIGTPAALAFHRHRFRRQATLDGLITLPIVIPEIVMASSLLLLFAGLGLRLGLTTVVLAHVAFARTLKGHGLAEGVSTRLVVYAAQLVRGGVTPKDACRMAMARPVTDDADMRKAIQELSSSIF